MNINKIFLFLIILLFQILSFNSVSYSDDDSNKENEETEINLDEEELPAIDPFAGGVWNTNQGSAETTGQTSQGSGLLNNMRLVGTILGEKKKNSNLFITWWRSL